MIPFIINSNLITQTHDLLSLESLWNETAGNVGNSYPTYSLLKNIMTEDVNIKKIYKEDKIISDNYNVYCINNIYSYDFSNADRDADICNNLCTHCLFFLQDQIRIQESYNFKLPYLKIEKFLKKIKKPIIVLGLGANDLPPFKTNFSFLLSKELKRFLKMLSDSTDYIGIRGYFTNEVLHSIGIDNTWVIGCPSYFENGQNRIIKKQASIKESDIVFTSSVSFSTINNCQITQDITESKYINAICYNNFNYDNFAEYHLKKMENRRYHFFSSIHSWKEFLSKYKFAYGTRLHGSIVAINSGIIAVCCNCDARTLEMCDFLKIPNIKILNREVKELNQLLELYESIDVDLINHEYTMLYSNFRSYMNHFDIDLLYHNQFYQPDIPLYKDDFLSNINKFRQSNHFVQDKRNNVI